MGIATDMVMIVVAARLGGVIVDQVRRHYPTVHIVARAEGMEHLKMLHDCGVHEAIQPEFEAGLAMTRQALLHPSVPVDLAR